MESLKGLHDGLHDLEKVLAECGLPACDIDHFYISGKRRLR
jgi:hypothetical protein